MTQLNSAFNYELRATCYGCIKAILRPVLHLLNVHIECVRTLGSHMGYIRVLKIYNNVKISILLNCAVV
jgi:hypothetical protein